MEFSIADWRIPVPADQGTLGTVQVGLTLNRRADSLSDGSARIVYRDIHVITRDRVDMRAAEMSIAVGVQGLRLDDVIAAVSTDAPPAPALAASRWSPVLERAWTIVRNGGLAGLTSDVAIVDGVFSDRRPDPAATFGRMSARNVLSALNEEAGRYELDYAVEGLAVRPDLVPAPQLIPSRVNVVMALERLPIRAWLDTGHLLLPARGTDRPSPDAQAVVGSLMIQAMMRMGTTWRIAPLELAAADAGGRLEGAITADPAAAFRVRAEGELVLRGVEALQREIAAHDPRRGPDSPGGVIAILAALGQQETGPGGEQVRRYRIALTPAGQLMLNGTDISPLLGGGARPPAQR
jgi:hypothetical protein